MCGVEIAPVLELDRRAFHDLQQGVLHALARRHPHLALGRFELVDLVDEDDAELSLAQVAIDLVYQTLQDRLDFLIDVFGLRQRGSIGRHKRHTEQTRQRLASQRLAGA